MAQETTCQTPGTEYGTHISHTLDGKTVVSVSVLLPMRLKLTQERAALLEANMHNAMELVLAPYFTES